ncbi:unnamed protein product [Urochloa decumbens]|uniref:Uncharacterized protein n=1 Tax=Urochloa decumbens TaxID=240449 RepID=A0ABC9BFI1_9POAL
MATGFVALLLAVSGAFAFGGSSFALLLSFMGVIASGNIIFAGVWMADDGPVPLPPIAGHGLAMLVAGVGALPVFLRRNIAFTGLLAASSAITAATGEACPALCFSALALFLLGISLINTGLRGA